MARGASPEYVRTPITEAVYGVDGRVRQAELLYERAVFTGDAAPLAEADRGLDAAEAELALARGRVMHARFLLRRDQDPAAAAEDPDELPLFERAARLYQAMDDLGGAAAARFWIGCVYQVIRHDDAVAVPSLAHSLELATRAGDKAVMAEALRHLGIAAHRAGNLDEARERLEESTRLRRETGQLPGAAANMVGLAYIAAAQERTDDALALIDEASVIAAASQANRILEQIDQVRAEVAGRLLAIDLVEGTCQRDRPRSLGDEENTQPPAVRRDHLGTGGRLHQQDAVAVKTGRILNRRHLIAVKRDDDLPARQRLPAIVDDIDLALEPRA